MDMSQNIIKDNSLEIELYDLETDPREQVSFASSHLYIILRIEEISINENSKRLLERFHMPASGDKE
jgi:hypothetical protein